MGLETESNDRLLFFIALNVGNAISLATLAWKQKVMQLSEAERLEFELKEALYRAQELVRRASDALKETKGGAKI